MCPECGSTHTENECGQWRLALACYESQQLGSWWYLGYRLAGEPWVYTFQVLEANDIFEARAAAKQELRSGTMPLDTRNLALDDPLKGAHRFVEYVDVP